MSMDVATFRVAYPPFANSTQYPDARISYWLDFAAIMVSGRRWQRSGLQDYGQGLLTAHYLTISEQYDSTTQSYVPGSGGTGAVASQSQSADGVSWSEGYDTSAYAGDGQLASTSYGRQFLDLRALVGAGGMQL